MTTTPDTPVAWRLVPVEPDPRLISVVAAMVRRIAIPISSDDDGEVYFDNGHARQIYKAITDASSPPAPDGMREVVAWCERDGDAWVCYDVKSETGQHITLYQTDRHGIDVFPLYAATPEPGHGEGET